MPYPERAITVDTESMCGFAGPLRNAATAINPYTLGPDRTATTASAVGPGYETLSVSPAISFSQRLGNPYPCPAPWRSEPRACVGDRRHSQSHRVNDKWPLLKAAAPGDGVGRITLTATAARPSRSWRGCRTHYFAPDGRGRPGERRSDAAFPATNELLAVAEHHWPQPGWYPRPPGRATLGGRLRPLAWARRPRRQAPARSSRSARRDRAAGAAPLAAPTPHHAKHQYKHDHDDQHPQPCRHGGLLGRPGAVRSDATAAHPSKQLVTAMPPPGPGSAAALRAGSRGPCTPRPAHRSGLAGRVPVRPGRRPGAGPGGAEPFGHATPELPGTGHASRAARGDRAGFLKTDPGNQRSDVGAP